MNPIGFPQANIVFGPPEGYAESQVRSIAAFCGESKQGSVDGDRLVVVCYQPDERELELIKQGKPIFLTCIGGLPPHFLSMSFEEATNPA